MRMKQNLLVCIAIALTGCSDDSPDNKCNPPCADGMTCVGGTCVDSTTICKPACTDGLVCVNNTCVDASTVCNPPCTGGMTCVGGTCVDPTTICEPACTDGLVCVNNICVDPTTICDPACTGGMTCIDNVCVDPTTICDPPCTGKLTCVNNTCTDLTVICDPECGPAEECIDNVCRSVCRPECDPEHQACNAETKTCDYIGNFCEAGSCSPDNQRACSAPDGSHVGTWMDCITGETCFHGVCLQDPDQKCTDGTCNDDNQACIGGSWKQCSTVEVCTEGACEMPIETCEAGTCPDETYMCGEDGTPVKCADDEVCDNGVCGPKSEKDHLLWTLCNVNSDCSYGHCVKSLTLSQMIDDPDNPGHEIGSVPVHSIDSRIPEGRGICTLDCTKDASICNTVSFSGQKYTCQLAYEADSPYPPKAEDGTALSLPFPNELDINMMETGVPFAAMCRPFVGKISAIPQDFGDICIAEENCKYGSHCVAGVCQMPCAVDDDCPLTFSCRDTADYKVCMPNSGTYSACRDTDNDGRGIGLCRYPQVDCNDTDPGTYYSTDAPKICALEADTNCNGRVDGIELLGSEDNCESCSSTCKTPPFGYNMSRVCYKNNGNKPLDDYHPETYKFECLTTCAPGYADCDGKPGCEINLIKEAEAGQNARTIYTPDRDGDGFGVMKDGYSGDPNNPVYNKNEDQRVFCCGGAEKCYGYVQNENPSITEKQWITVDISTGYSDRRTDCNDNDPNINPGTKEICDGIDNNCSGTIDEPENLIDDKGQPAGIGSKCDTGNDGICQYGKKVCESVKDVYKIYCKADHDAETYEYCNNKSDDCDSDIDEGGVAVDPHSGLPIFDEGKGFRLYDKTDPNYQEHICMVPGRSVKTHGQCAYGFYKCDGENEQIICDPFKPADYDFAGDNYDANCDGFDGDLKHTLFVSNSKYNYMSEPNDDVNSYQLKNYSNSGILHVKPLASLKKAVEIVNACTDGVGCYELYFHTQSSTYYANKAECEKHNPFSKQYCQTRHIGWDILVESGDKPQYENSEVGIVGSSSSRTFASSWADKKTFQACDPLTSPDKLIEKPIVPNPAWLRIYGGSTVKCSETSCENNPEAVRWNIDSKTSTIDFKLTEDQFYTLDRYIALIDMAGTDNGSLYMQNINLTAKASFAVDAAKASNGKSPNTLIGINANNAKKVHLNNVNITLQAPSGINGEDGETVSVSDLHSNLSGINGAWLVEDNTTSYQLAKSYQAGHILGDNYSPGTVPTCSDGTQIDPGKMGGYNRLYIDNENTRMEYFHRSEQMYPDDYEYDEDSSKDKNNIRPKRIFRMKHGTDPTAYEEFSHSYGISSNGNRNSVSQKIVINDEKSKWGCGGFAGGGLCTSPQSELSQEFNEACKDNKNRHESYGLIDRNRLIYNDPVHCEGKKPIMWYGSEVLKTYDDIVNYRSGDLFSPTQYDSLNMTNQGKNGGRVNQNAQALQKINNGYSFIGQSPAKETDGTNGNNGKGGSGMPPLRYPAEFYNWDVWSAGQYGMKSDLYSSSDYNQNIPFYQRINVGLFYSKPTSADTDLWEDRASYSIKNYFSMMYRHYISIYYEQHYFDTIRNKKTPYSIYVVGAAGGSGGCGGKGGTGGRPGGSAIGITFAPKTEGSIIDIKNASFHITAGDGGTGGNGTNGTAGYSGGKEISDIKDVKWRREGGDKTLRVKGGGNGQDGLGGTGGSGGAGAQGGYALGLIVDCFNVNASNYADCKKKLQISLPTNLSVINTEHGKHGYKPTNNSKGYQYAAASENVSNKNAGKGGSATPQQKTLQNAEVINEQSNSGKQVKSNSPIAYIYSYRNGNAVLGTKEM